MTPDPTSTPNAPRLDATAADTPAERRRNAALRELIDEMLASIRAATHRELWTPEERTQYERELSEIMQRVRTEAVDRTRAGEGPRPAA